MYKNKRWHELTSPQKIAIILLGAIQISLLIAALWDIRHRSTDEIKGSKAAWAMVSLVNFIGPMAYFSFGRKRLAQET